MKKILLALSFLFLSPAVSFALTPTNAPSATVTVAPTAKVSEDPKNINVLNDLKDKIASRVAQLNLVQKKGVIGTVNAISGTQITIADLNGNDVIIDVDELTKFSSPSAKGSFGISDLTKGAIVDILGLYNKQSQHILARFLTVTTLSRYVVGEVASVDTDKGIMQVISDDGTITPIDVETVTKTYMYNKEAGMEKSGFSKVQQGNHVVVIGFTDTKNAKQILATRINIFPHITPNPRIIIPQQAISPDTTIIPSTGSGKKLTPIVK